MIDNFAFGGALSYALAYPGEKITIDDLVKRCNRRHDEAVARGEVSNTSPSSEHCPCPSAYR